MSELGADGPDLVLSSVAKAVEKRERKLHEFETASVVDGVPLSTFFVRCPTSYEELDAQIWAARFRARELGESAELERAVNATLETLHVVSHACLKREANGELLPAFGPPLWMAKRLKSEEVERLLDLVNEVRIRESGRPREVNADMIDDLVSSLAECSESEAAELCIGLTRDDLVQSARHLCAMVQGLVMNGVVFDDGEG